MERTAIVGSPRSTRVMKLLEEVEWRLALAFFGKALVERTKIDHHSLMSSAADLFHLVARAAAYIMKLPKADQDLEEWQGAVEALLLVAELNGPSAHRCHEGIEPERRAGVRFFA